MALIKSCLAGNGGNLPYNHFFGVSSPDGTNVTSVQGDNTVSPTPLYAVCALLDGTKTKVTPTGYAWVSVIHADGTQTNTNATPNQDISLSASDIAVLVTRLNTGSQMNVTLS